MCIFCFVTFFVATVLSTTPILGLSTHLSSAINSAAPDRTTGGSSSGSAAAVAGGLADIAIGSDTLGSIRIPANNCGLIGLRTTLGRIPLDGAFIAAPGSDTFGWFAKNAEIYEKVGEILLKDEDKENIEMGKIRVVTVPGFEEVLFGDEEREEYGRMKKVLESVIGEIEERKAFKVRKVDVDLTVL